MEAARASLQEQLAELLNAEWAVSNAPVETPRLGPRPRPGLGLALGAAISFLLALGTIGYSSSLGVHPRIAQAWEAAGLLAGLSLVFVGIYRQRRAVSEFDAERKRLMQSAEQSREQRLLHIRSQITQVRAELAKNKSMLLNLKTTGGEADTSPATT